MTNYSFQTSLPAYNEAPALKKRQCDEILAFIAKGANNLLQLSQLTGLPQSTVSGRCNDLIKENKAEYRGYTDYANRVRKIIVAIKKLAPGKTKRIIQLNK